MRLHAPYHHLLLDISFTLKQALAARAIENLALLLLAQEGRRTVQ